VIRNSHLVIFNWRLSAWFFFLAVINLTVYNLQLAETNAYVGFRPIDINFVYCINLIISLFFLAQLIPNKIQKPSDFFLFFYGFFVVTSYVIFYPVEYKIDVVVYFIHIFFLILPIIIIKIASRFKLKVIIPKILKESQLEFIVYLISIVGLILVLINSSGFASFDLNDVYERRIEGRAAFTAGAFTAYLNGNVCNGLVPFLSFLAGFKNKKLLLVFSITIGIAYFYAIGIKAHLLFLALSYVMGIGCRRADFDIVSRFIFKILVILLIFFFIEYWLYSKSDIAELFFRRTFSVPAHVISQYMQLISGSEGAYWTALSGINHAPDGVTYLVGFIFYNSHTANINTNAFVYALATSGLLGYFGIIFFIMVFFIVLDAAYLTYKNNAFLFIGFIYALLLTEQSALTALSSSGIALLTTLAGLAVNGWRLNTSPLFTRSLPQ
jgi:hypothetical protein